MGLWLALPIVVCTPCLHLLCRLSAPQKLGKYPPSTHCKLCVMNSMCAVLWSPLCARSPCHVVYTDYRPTPLEHYVFPAGGDGLFMVVDPKGTFRQGL